MKKKLLVVNGENYWQEYLLEFEVVRKSIQDSSWVLKEGRLFVADTEGVIEPEAVLWRIGAIKPSDIQTTALNLVDLAGLPCINPVATLKKGYDRLSMLSEVKKHDLPLIDFNVVTKSTLLKNISIPFPFVVKVGNYHGGFGKVLVEDEKKWQDIQDLLFITQDYITVEPFIEYRRDIRYLLLEGECYTMSRRGKFWKANIGTMAYELIEPDTVLAAKTEALRQSLEADILAVDILEDERGEVHIVEYNDIPGLSGFPDQVKHSLADIIRKKVS